ncbi:MAG: AAA family ATPase, partial [Limisphaerales bacterium]
MGLEELQRLWDGQMTVTERASLQNLAVNPPRLSNTPATLAETSVTWAEEHLFERRSVVNEHELWRHALEHARGQDVSLAEIQAVTKRRDYIRNEDKPGTVTVREHLQREWDIVCMAKDGRNNCHALAFPCRASNRQLDDEQRNAVNWLVTSSDFISLFRGGAGTGKSFTLCEVQREFQARGCAVLALAPQRQQVMGLESDGLKNVETVSAFLARRQMPRNAVVLVDEAGQIGGKQMHALLRIVKENRGRVILSGDTRQHGAVEATDALRAIEKYSGIQAAELTNIRRQNPALGKSKAEHQRIEQYKQAVADARDGNLARSFNRLDKLNAIEQCTFTNQHEKLAARYLELAEKNQSCVVVSQSWNEIHRVNDEIRSALKMEKRIGSDETAITAIVPVDLTDAQKRDARSYAPDSVLVFNRDMRGFKAGETARMKAITDEHLIVEGDARLAKIPFKQLGKVTVCQSKEMALSPGDRL